MFAALTLHNPNVGGSIWEFQPNATLLRIRSNLAEFGITATLQ
jgi:hypothetical protein